MHPEFKVWIKVQKPIAEVFDAVYQPQKLSAYFTTGGASAPMDEGTSPTWDFADFPGAFPVHVKQSVPRQKIVFEWKAMEENYNTSVEVDFKEIDPQNTLVELRESGWKDSPAGAKNSYLNCMGWSQMLCCLKAYLEYGINLRKGAY